MIEMHKPIILAFLETKMGDHNKLAEDLGFLNKIQYPAVRTSWGIQRFRAYTRSLFLQELEHTLVRDYRLILQQEQEFWRLKSRISWLAEGDNNTRFFHTSTLNRRRRNRINSLRDDSRNWNYSEENIKNSIFQYYNNLYSTEHHAAPLGFQLNPSSRGSICKEDHSRLEAIPEITEIKSVVFSFKPDKTPGADGIHPLLYQRYWDIIGPDVVNFCRQTFHKATMEEAVNNTYLCLIPKCRNAINLMNFRPIGACNTQYKIITKIIAYRLKQHLPTLISYTQSSFLSNRRTTDNAIIVQEYITHFAKMRGKKANMILKTDLEKAFDRIEWSFIREGPRISHLFFADDLTLFARADEKTVILS
ncbi:hypothetical protein FXO37_12812 [Capsicum annuum]|nr:hypothetical protein FXO37_12812 [Capsicum annuum]